MKFVHVLGVALAAFPSELHGQMETSRAWSVDKDRLRVVFPRREQYDPLLASRLAAAVAEQAPLLGLPASDWLGRGVTISLARQSIEGQDARSIAGQRLIILPLQRSAHWDDARMARIIRHELAHIALEAYLGFMRPALWFEEGFAEWASGGLTCEEAVRVHLRVATQANETPFSLVVVGNEARSRFSYSIYTTFFEYLDERATQSLRSGVIVRRVKEFGEEQGIASAVGAPFVDIVQAWRAWLLDRYGAYPEDRCP